MKEVAFVLFLASMCFAVSDTLRVTFQQTQTNNVIGVKVCSDGFGCNSKIYFTQNDAMNYIVGLCNVTSKYIIVEGSPKVLDCSAWQAAELSPTIRAYTKLQDAYSTETMKIGKWSDIGFRGYDGFFDYREIPGGISVTTKHDMHGCKKGSEWIVTAVVDKDYTYKLIEPPYADCKAFLKDSYRDMFIK